MCGRYTVRRVSIVHYGLNAAPTEAFEEFTERAHFNIAPRMFAPVIRVNSEGRAVGELMRWGLVPHWVTGKAKAEPINARCETAATSAMFRQALERRRCLILADGFYEWQGVEKPKRPHFIHMRDDRPFAFAGMWERWRPGPDEAPLDTFTVVTTAPNDVMRPIHDRMPVILEPGDYEKWIDVKSAVRDVAPLLRPYAAEPMEAYPVGTRVNTPRNDAPDLVERVEGDDAR
jgi:putative SOS response-associated peptidase YedK